MNFKQIYLFSLFVLFTSSLCLGQNIDGGIIKYSKTHYGSISFPGLIKGWTLTCPEENFNIIKTKKTITIKPGDNAVSPCIINVDEGDEDDVRNHMFKVYFVPGDGAINERENIINLSTVDKLKEYIAYLEKHQNDEKTQPVAAPPKEKATEVILPPHTEKNPSSISLSGGDSLITISGMTIPKGDLNKRIIRCIQLFNNYSEKLGNPKNVKNGTKADNIEKAMKLFNNDKTKMVEITSRTQPTRAKSIDVYLDALTRLPYAEVFITKQEIQFISELRLQNGRWYGYVSYLQNFTGIAGDGRTYKSVDRKNQEIEVEVYEEVIDGVSNKRFRVFLGNISVAKQQ